LIHRSCDVVAFQRSGNDSSSSKPSRKRLESSNTWSVIVLLQFWIGRLRPSAGGSSPRRYPACVPFFDIPYFETFSRSSDWRNAIAIDLSAIPAEPFTSQMV
jgi:hypothetical protein